MPMKPATPRRRRTLPTVVRRTRERSGGEKRRSPAHDRARSGKLRDMKRPACYSRADRRVSKLRPGLCASRAAGMRNRPEGKTRSDRCSKTKLRAPSQEPSGGGPASNSGRRTGPRTGDLRQTPSIRSVLVAEDQRQTPHCQRSLLGDSMVNPCNRDHAPRFLGSETLEKAKQCSHYCPALNRLGMPCRVCS